MSKYVIKGPVVEDNVRMGIGEYFWRTADKFGDRISQIDADTFKQETFAEVRSRAVKVAIHLRKIGVKPKDVVMVCPENDLDHLIPVLAALFLGAYVVSSVPSFELVDIYNTINDVKPKAIFTTNKKLDVIEEVLKKLDSKAELYVMGESSVYPTMSSLEKTETEEEKTFKPTKVDIHDPAFIIFSSGTTSRPKGICLSHFSLLAGACRYNEDQSILLDNPYIVGKTCFWISSLFITIFTFIFAQARLVAPVFSHEKFLQLVEKYKIEYYFTSFNNIIGLTDMDQDIVKKYDLSSMKIVFTSGRLEDPKYSKKLKQVFPFATVMQQYGTTEIGASAIGITADNLRKDKHNSLGKVTQNIQIKIVDPEKGQPLGPNEQGEILIKSPYSMIGFTGNLDSSQCFDEDGFYKTGDLGYYDEDEYFYFVDRLSQVFKVNSYKIYPGMVEDILKLHPAIKEAVLLGIPNDQGITRAVACLELKKDANATEQEISDFVVSHLGEIYRPTGGVKFLKEFPLTSTGKVARNKVKELITSDETVRNNVK